MWNLKFLFYVYILTVVQKTFKRVSFKQFVHSCKFPPRCSYTCLIAYIFISREIAIDKYLCSTHTSKEKIADEKATVITIL